MHFLLVQDFGWLQHSLATSTKDLNSNYKKLKMTLALSAELPLLNKKRVWRRPISCSS